MIPLHHAPGPCPADAGSIWPESAPPALPVPLRRLLTAVIALLLLLAVLAGTVPIGSAVIAPGHIAIAAQVRHLSNPAGGVIARILVHNGQQVSAGQILLQLDDRVAGASAGLVADTVIRLAARRARLVAEREGMARIDFLPAIARAGANASAETARAMADERRLFDLHRADAAAVRAQADAHLAQDRAQITGLSAQIAALREQRRLVEPERQGLHDLWQRRLVTIGRLNQIERTAVDLQGSLASAEAQLAGARARLAESRAAATALMQARRIQAATDLAEVDLALNQHEAARIGAADSRDRSALRAPCAGTVERLGFAGSGEVVRPGEPIVDIVPARDAMVAEAMVSPAQIGHVRIGAPVRVRLATIDRSTTPELDGTVVAVASDRSEAGAGGPAFYAVRVAITPRAGIALRSGLPAEVHIGGGSRSLLSYLIKPLSDQFARAFRED